MSPSKDISTCLSLAMTLRTPATDANTAASAGESNTNSTWRIAFDRRSATDSTVMRKPSRMMPTRSATRWTSESVWLDRKTVRPSAVTSLTIL